ncbi:MAG: tryptophan synthase subunit alpha [Clostridia bacterium]|nr:tryptophan synthase subunit alpha [Clostridia bacterium]
MSNIYKALLGAKAVIPYVTCGDPNMAVSEQLIVALCKAGADIIELGIPFSDPVAEDAALIESNSRALGAGITSADIFGMIKRVRARVDTPLVLVAYANSVLSRGIDNFTDSMRDSGIDALILKDVPHEESAEFRSACADKGIDYISSVSLSSIDRAITIAEQAEGFINCYMSPDECDCIAQLSAISRIASACDIPCVINADCYDSELTSSLMQHAGGIVIPSAIVTIISNCGRDSIAAAADYIAAARRAIK